jgi:hypothetical protein
MTRQVRAEVVLVAPLHPCASALMAVATTERNINITLRRTEGNIEKMPALKFVRSVSFLTMIQI